jgi:hypothetical protein
MNESFSPQQSLQLIQSMIDKTRKSYSDKSRYFLIWGWTAMVALLGQYVLKSVFHYYGHYYAWWITVIPMVLTFVFLGREKKQTGAKTYVSESMSHLWAGMGIGFFVISMIFVKYGWGNCYPFFITFYGLGTFISGRILQFTPFIAGGIISWMLAIASAWFDMEYQMLFAAAALFVSYIIPGHLLSAKYHRQKNTHGAG